MTSTPTQESPEKPKRYRNLADKIRADALLKYGECCGICGIEPKDIPKDWVIQLPYFCVDHNHKTGHVRGVLCRRCNIGMGYFGDLLDDLRKVVVYLERAEVK